MDTLDGKVDIIAELVLPDSSSAEWAGKSTDTVRFRLSARAGISLWSYPSSPFSPLCLTTSTLMQIEDVRVFIGSAWAPDIQLEEPSDAAPAAPATVPESPPQQRAATTMAAFLSDDIPLSPASPRRAPSPPPAPGTTVASLFSDMRPVALSDNPLFGILSPPPAEPSPSRRLAVEANMEPIELAKVRLGVSAGVRSCGEEISACENEATCAVAPRGRPGWCPATGLRSRRLWLWNGPLSRAPPPSSLNRTAAHGGGQRQGDH